MSYYDVLNHYPSADLFLMFFENGIGNSNFDCIYFRDKEYDPIPAEALSTLKASMVFILDAPRSSSILTKGRSVFHGPHTFLGSYIYAFYLLKRNGAKVKVLDKALMQSYKALPAYEKMRYYDLNGNPIGDDDMAFLKALKELDLFYENEQGLRRRVLENYEIVEDFIDNLIDTQQLLTLYDVLVKKEFKNFIAPPQQQNNYIFWFLLSGLLGVGSLFCYFFWQTPE